MIKGHLTGGKQVVQSLRQRVPAITQRVERVLERLTIVLLGKVKGKLSDDVLRVRTGRLRRSITYRMDGKGTDHITGTVGTNVSYAKIHELGFTGAVNVRGHLRMVKQAWGKPIEPRQVQVAGHSRNVSLPARSFLRSSLEEMNAVVKDEIDKAIKG